MPDTDGTTYEPAHDRKRLVTLRDRILSLMMDGAWRTLEDIRGRCGGSETGCSAKLRDLRKEAHGGHTVDARRRGLRSAGIWEYRLAPPLPAVPETGQQDLFDTEPRPRWW